eukprot:13296866-Ditylum_brightwellii.AAC.1
MKWSELYQHKDSIVDPICSHMYKWKQAGMPVKILSRDNIGDNNSVEKRGNSADWKLNLKMEYTARQMPQQNSLAEVSFNTIGNCGRTIMIAANVPNKKRYKLFREAFSCATMLDWL